MKFCLQLFLLLTGLESFYLERSLDLEKHLYPRRLESCWLPPLKQELGLADFISAGSAGPAQLWQDRGMLREGEAQMELLSLVPDLLENSAGRGVEQCKVAFSISGAHPGVRRTQAHHCGSAAPA